MPDVLTVFLNKDDDDDDEMGIGEFNAGGGGGGIKPSRRKSSRNTVFHQISLWTPI